MLLSKEKLEVIKTKLDHLEKQERQSRFVIQFDDDDDGNNELSLVAPVTNGRTTWSTVSFSNKKQLLRQFSSYMCSATSLSKEEQTSLMQTLMMSKSLYSSEHGNDSVVLNDTGTAVISVNGLKQCTVTGNFYIDANTNDNAASQKEDQEDDDCEEGQVFSGNLAFVLP